MDFNTLLQSINIQQLIISSLALSAGGIIGFWLKDFPKQLWSFLIKECTCTLVITSQHFAYLGCMTYFSEELNNKKLKSYKVIDKAGKTDTSTLSLGYGDHFLWFNKTPLIISLEKDNNNQQAVDKDRLIIKKLGRNKKVFEKLLDKINTITIGDENSLETFQFTSGCYWTPKRGIQKRNLDTVFLEKEKKDRIIATLDNFKSKEQWYIDNGIPYHLGILLYGPPGTGKTSLIKAIASYYNYGISYLPASRLTTIEDAASSFRRGTILVIEDIDCQTVVQNRNNNDEITIPGEPIFSSMGKELESLSKMPFSDILNSLDGLLSRHGYIFIATTNHIEKLDSALLRPGRVDLAIEIGYVTIEGFNQFLQNYYNTSVNIDIRENITAAELQQLLLENKSAEEVIQWAKK